MKSYDNFIKGKQLAFKGDGLNLKIRHDKFLNYQDAITNWAVKKGGRA